MAKNEAKENTGGIEKEFDNADVNTDCQKVNLRAIDLWHKYLWNNTFRILDLQDLMPSESNTFKI